MQACLSDQGLVQQSLQQLQALGEQLKSQIDACSSASLKSDQLSLSHRLAALEHGLPRQQEVLLVWMQKLLKWTINITRYLTFLARPHFCCVCF